MLATNKCAAFGALLTKLSLAILAIAALAFTSRSFAGPGDLYVTDLETGSIIRYLPDGTASTFDTGLISPQGIAFDKAKNMYVADAGDGSDGAGVIYKYDITIGAGSKTTFFTGLFNPQGMTQDGSNLLVSDKGTGNVFGIPFNPGPKTTFQIIPTPLGLDSRGINDGAGLFRFIANGPSVRKVNPDQTTHDFDFSADGSRAVTLDLTGNAFVSTDNGKVIEIFVADNTTADFSTGFTLPTGMDFRPAKFSGDTDRVGFLYVADTTAGTISQISQTGIKTTFIASAGQPNYMAFEIAGAPVVVTGIASNITNTGATLHGTVNPDGNPTTYHFEYGLTTAYGSNTTVTGAGSGLDAVPVSAAITGLTPGTVYHFRLSATNGNGTVVGADATFTTFGAPPTPTPTPTPIAITGAATGIGDTTATVNGTVNPAGNATTYQFQYGLTAAYGNTTTSTSAGSGFVAVPVSAALSGLTAGTLYHFRVTATNAGGTANGADATFTTTGGSIPPDSALNISTRVDVETGDNVGIGGFIINGTDPKLVVIRGIGPSLALTGVLSDPFLELHDSTGAIIATNDNWKGNSIVNQQILTDNGLAPQNDFESALVQTLDPGPYTAILKGSSGQTGIGLVEIYDLDDPSVAGELANISTRGLVGTVADDTVLIGGVILGPAGGENAKVIIRAIGPSLADANPPVANPLMDPVLDIHNGDGDLIASNDNWKDDPNMQLVIDNNLAPTSDAESAIYADLIAGGYTAVVSGAGGTTGVGLVEIYHVP